MRKALVEKVVNWKRKNDKYFLNPSDKSQYKPFELPSDPTRVEIIVV
jgi:hypothetical protein